MSKGLINPATGRPFPPKARNISDQELLQILQVHDHKLQALNIQLTQLGLFTEYLIEKISTYTVDNEELPNLDMKMDEFPVWADARLAEIREQAEAMQAENARKQAADAQEYLEKTSGNRTAVDIKLNE